MMMMMIYNFVAPYAEILTSCQFFCTF